MKLSEQDLASIANYVDLRLAQAIDRTESQIHQIANRQTQLARKVEEIAHGAQPRKESRR